MSSRASSSSLRASTYKIKSFTILGMKKKLGGGWKSWKKIEGGGATVTFLFFFLALPVSSSFQTSFFLFLCIATLRYALSQFFWFLDCDQGDHCHQGDQGDKYKIQGDFLKNTTTSSLKAIRGVGVQTFFWIFYILKYASCWIQIFFQNLKKMIFDRFIDVLRVPI